MPESAKLKKVCQK